MRERLSGTSQHRYTLGHSVRWSLFLGDASNEAVNEFGRGHIQISPDGEQIFIARRSATRSFGRQSQRIRSLRPPKHQCADHAKILR
jgi:hypothetical protein